MGSLTRELIKQAGLLDYEKQPPELTFKGKIFWALTVLTAFLVFLKILWDISGHKIYKNYLRKKDTFKKEDETKVETFDSLQQIIIEDGQTLEELSLEDSCDHSNCSFNIVMKKVYLEDLQDIATLLKNGFNIVNLSLGIIKIRDLNELKDSVEAIADLIKEINKSKSLLKYQPFDEYVTPLKDRSNKEFSIKVILRGNVAHLNPQQQKAINYVIDQCSRKINYFDQKKQTGLAIFRDEEYHPNNGLALRELPSNLNTKTALGYGCSYYSIPKPFSINNNNKKAEKYANKLINFAYNKSSIKQPNTNISFFRNLIGREHGVISTMENKFKEKYGFDDNQARVRAYSCYHDLIQIHPLIRFGIVKSVPVSAKNLKKVSFGQLPRDLMHIIAEYAFPANLKFTKKTSQASNASNERGIG